MKRVTVSSVGSHMQREAAAADAARRRSQHPHLVAPLRNTKRHPSAPHCLPCFWPNCVREQTVRARSLAEPEMQCAYMASRFAVLIQGTGAGGNGQSPVGEGGTCTRGR